MFCSKCGAQNDDDKNFCSNCGTSLNMQQSDTRKPSSKLLTALILNVLALVIPILLAVSNDMTSGTSSSAPSTGDFHIHITTEASYSQMGLVVATRVYLLIFLLGFIIYFLKSAKGKTVLSYVYMFASIANIILLFSSIALYIIVTCGLALVFFIPGVIQIVAGIIYIAGSREYALQ